MQKRFYLIMAVLVVFGMLLAGCGNEEAGETNGLVVGENAFETGVYIKCNSSEKVMFFVEPTSDDIRAAVEENWNNGGMSAGNYGTLALVEGRKKGEKAEIDGSFTVFVNDSGGPSVTVPVKGTYVIDELTGYDNSYFFIYTDDGLNQVTKEEWVALKM